MEVAALSPVVRPSLVVRSCGPYEGQTVSAPVHVWGSNVEETSRAQADTLCLRVVVQEFAVGYEDSLGTPPGGTAEQCVG